MKQPTFIANAPIDEKRISLIERILSRLIRKSVKTTSAMLTPYPISNCVSGEDVSGTVLKYMFAARGIVDKGLIKFDKRLKSGVKITITLKNDLGSQSKEYVASGNQMLIKPELVVFSGDKLIIKVSPIDLENEMLSEVWMAFTWTPYIGEATVKSFLIDKLDEIEV